MSRRTVVLIAVVAGALAVFVALVVVALVMMTRSTPATPEATPGPVSAPPPTLAPERPERGGVADAGAMPTPLPPRAPTAKDVPVIIEKNGVRQASCAGACFVESQCGFRAVDACKQESCEGDVRKANRSDFCLAGAADCGAAAACPCEEACWKRGECTGDHKQDKACTTACETLVKQAPATAYVENRCVLETSCRDIATCGRVE